jgi:hypothetical protein
MMNATKHDELSLGLFFWLLMLLAEEGAFCMPAGTAP